MIENYAHLTILIDGDDPSVVTDLLGLEPTEARIRGTSPSIRSPYSLWAFSSKDSLSPDAETSDHIRRVVEQLEPRSAELEQVRDIAVDVRLWVMWSTDNAGPHVWIDPDVLRAVGALGLSLHVDAYRHLEVPGERLEGLQRLAWEADSGGNWRDHDDYIEAVAPPVVLDLLDLAAERASLAAEVAYDRPIHDQLAGAARAMLDLVVARGWHDDPIAGSIGQALMDLTDADAGRQWWRSWRDELPPSVYEHTSHTGSVDVDE